MLLLYFLYVCALERTACGPAWWNGLSFVIATMKAAATCAQTSFSGVASIAPLSLGWRPRRVEAKSYCEEEDNPLLHVLIFLKPRNHWTNGPGVSVWLADAGASRDGRSSSPLPPSSTRLGRQSWTAKSQPEPAGWELGAIVLRPTDERATPRRDELETCMDEGKDSLRPLHPSS